MRVYRGKAGGREQKNEACGFVRLTSAHPPSLGRRQLEGGEGWVVDLWERTIGSDWVMVSAASVKHLYYECLACLGASNYEECKTIVRRNRRGRLAVRHMPDLLTSHGCVGPTTAWLLVLLQTHHTDLSLYCSNFFVSCYSICIFESFCCAWFLWMWSINLPIAQILQPCTAMIAPHSQQARQLHLHLSSLSGSSDSPWSPSKKKLRAGQEPRPREE